MKNISKNIPSAKKKILQKIKKKKLGGVAQRKQQLKFEKKIHAIGSEIIDATDGRTDRRTMDDGRISISLALVT